MTPQVDFVNTTELPFLVNKLSNKSNYTHSGTCANINALSIVSPNDADPTVHFGEVQTITMPDGYQAHGNMFGKQDLSTCGFVFSTINTFTT